ncbi:unnamed protein product [Vitrella brassicaformis CCMP3155]|uniref:Protein kinase domain-containing protein n=1 Tax=Vitrella brassicaformis (strain CCMP3155) TaxID=1169540 RepID=A0A0G4FG12_VITBC|nr:unnamed protein product [Vitrella brassicaformis CCMP3155]|eukprot:CEM12098.1 unnamed protein product [Vitrella brassicaformis CCMP3155]
MSSADPAFAEELQEIVNRGKVAEAERNRETAGEKYIRELIKNEKGKTKHGKPQQGEPLKQHQSQDLGAVAAGQARQPSNESIENIIRRLMQDELEPFVDISYLKDIYKRLLRNDHPHIVQIFELLEDNEHLYVAMEKLPGANIFDVLPSPDVLHNQESEVKRIVMQALFALQYMHDNILMHEELGLIHRDIKGENLMFAADGTVKLTDFDMCFFMDTTNHPPYIYRADRPGTRMYRQVISRCVTKNSSRPLSRASVACRFGQAFRGTLEGVVWLRAAETAVNYEKDLDKAREFSGEEHLDELEAVVAKSENAAAARQTPIINQPAVAAPLPTTSVRLAAAAAAAQSALTSPALDDMNMKQPRQYIARHKDPAVRQIKTGGKPKVCLGM